MRLSWKGIRVTQPIQLQSPVVGGLPKPIPSDPVGDPWCSLLLFSSCFQ